MTLAHPSRHLSQSVAPTAVEPAVSAAAVTRANLTLDLPRLVERMHRRFLDIVRAELSRLDADGLNPVQAMQLMDIDDEVTVQELIDRGHYVGSNALYNVRKLAQAGYVEPSRSPNDRRALRVKLTDKGRALCEHLHARLAAIPTAPNGTHVAVGTLESAYRVLRDVERAWDDHLRFGRGG